MTNKAALILALLVAAALVLDHIFDWGATLFLAKKFVDMVEWIAFWR